MIINLRGTHGVGKTTIVRTIMATYPKRTPVYIDGRRNPIGYRCRSGKRKLFVVGSYEHPVSGGCDNVPNVKLMFDTVRTYLAKGYAILLEGIVAQHSTPNFIALSRETAVHVVWIDMSAKRAIRAVRRRRRASGNDAPFDPINLHGEIDRCRWTVAKLRKESDATIRVVHSRARAHRIIVRLLDELGS